MVTLAGGAGVRVRRGGQRGVVSGQHLQMGCGGWREKGAGVAQGRHYEKLEGESSIYKAGTGRWGMKRWPWTRDCDARQTAEGSPEPRMAIWAGDRILGVIAWSGYSRP